MNALGFGVDYTTLLTCEADPMQLDLGDESPLLRGFLLLVEMLEFTSGNPAAPMENFFRRGTVAKKSDLASALGKFEKLLAEVATTGKYKGLAYRGRLTSRFLICVGAKKDTKHREAQLEAHIRSLFKISTAKELKMLSPAKFTPIQTLVSVKRKDSAVYVRPQAIRKKVVIDAASKQRWCDAMVAAV